MKLRELELPKLELVDLNTDYSTAQTIFIDFDEVEYIPHENNSQGIYLDKFSVTHSELSDKGKNQTLTDSDKKFTVSASTDEEYFCVNAKASEYNGFHGQSEAINTGNKLTKNYKAFAAFDKVSAITITEIIAEETPTINNITVKNTPSNLISFHTWTQSGGVYLSSGGMSTIEYNEYTPTDAGTHSVAGCVAIATSQILYYWGDKQKTEGVNITLTSLSFDGSDHYTSNDIYSTVANIDIDGDAIANDFLSFSQLNTKLANIEYDFDPDEIATLAFGVGIKVESHYSASSTGADVSNVKDFLVDNGFTSSSYVWELDYDGLLVSDKINLQAEMIDDINNGMVVLLGITDLDDYSGHAILADGYDNSTNKFHLNMGWGDFYNDWYSLDDLPYGFDIIDEIIYNITPDVIAKPTVTVSVTDSSAGEPSDDGYYRISRTGDTDSALTVYFSMSGTATKDSDYTIGSSVTLASGTAYTDIKLNVIDDALTESTESAILTLDSNSNYDLGSTTSGTINITDNDVAKPTVTVSVTDSSAGEPSDDGTYRITRTGSTASSLTVYFSMSGTATKDSDYTIGSSVTIASGAAYADVKLDVIDDALTESTESAILTLDSNSNYDLGSTASGTVNITDNDNDTEKPTVTVSVTDSSAGEPSDDGTYRITRTGSTASSLTVYFSMSGTATKDSDYTIGSSVTIASGAAYADVKLDVIDDTLIESTESAILTLDSDSSYVLGSTTSGTVDVLDNDTGNSMVSVAVTNSSINEATDNGYYRISRTGVTSSTLTVYFSMSGTATDDSDYTIGSSVTFAAGESYVYVELDVIDDALVESTECAIITLRSNSNYNLGTAKRATIDIISDDVPPDTPDGLIYTVAGSNITLDWNDSTNDIAEYIVEYSVNADFSSAVSTTAAISELDITGLSEAVYHWRVKAFDNNSNESDWSVGNDITVDITAPDVPAAPVFSIDGNNVSLDWSDSTDNLAGLDKYTVEYSVNADFSGAISANTTASELVLTGLADAVYHWRVKSVDNSGNESAWNNGSEITIDISAPDIPAALEFTVNDSNVTLDWNDSSDNLTGFKEYVVEYSTNAGFIGATSQTVTDSELDLNNMHDDIYYWRVKSIDNNGNESAWSDGSDITVDITAPDVPVALGFILNGNNVSLDWSNSADNLTGLDEYIVEYSVNANFSNANSTTVTTSELSLNSLPDGIYYWRVKSIDNNGNESAWSTGSDITVDITTPDVPASLGVTVTGNNVSLDWTDSADNLTGVKEYVVEYSTDAGFVGATSQTVIDSELNLNSMHDDIYYWRVKSIDNNGNESAWNNGSDITVDITAPNIPASLTFAGTGNNISLDWSDSNDNLTGFKEYVMEYSTDDGFTGAISQTVTDSELDLNSMPDGIYYWRVKSIDNNGNESAWNNGNNITVDITAPDVPVGLDRNQISEYTILCWDASNDNLTGIKEYVIQYADNAEFNNGTEETTTINKLTINGLAYGNYYWHVKSMDNADNSSAWSTTDIVNISDHDIDAGGDFDVAAVLDTDSLNPISGYVGIGDAYDYYKFIPTDNCKFDFSLTGLSTKIKGSIVSYNIANDSYKRIANIKTDKKTGLTKANNVLLRDGEIYYVLIESADKGKGKYNTDYTLDIDGELFPEATNNNSWQTAQPLGDAPIDGWVGFGDNSDWYEFDMTAVGAVELKLSNLQSDANINLYLYDNAKDKLKNISKAKSKGSADELISKMVDTGTYYVEVISGKKVNSASYNLDLDITYNTTNV